jgi:hypothetical protein
MNNDLQNRWSVVSRLEVLILRITETGVDLVHVITKCDIVSETS